LPAPESRRFPASDRVLQCYIRFACGSRLIAPLLLPEVNIASPPHQ
jgi:hypothetical protein